MFTLLGVTLTNPDRVSTTGRGYDEHKLECVRPNHRTVTRLKTLRKSRASFLDFTRKLIKSKEIPLAVRDEFSASPTPGKCESGAKRREKIVFSAGLG